jgi:GRAM domain-containing protein 4
MRRRLLPYPTADQLRAHRREITRANEFSERIQSRLTASSSFGLKEIWRLVKVFNTPKKTLTRDATKGKVEKGKQAVKSDEGNDGEQVVDDIQADDVTVLDDAKDDPEVADRKADILNGLSEIADIHERVKKYVSPVPRLHV